MKRIKILFTCVCACMVFAVLSGCKNAVSGSKPVVNGNAGEGTPPTRPKIPEGIVEKKFSQLSVDEQAEITSLYGYYWSDDGTRNECPAIDADRIAVYNGNAFMSRSFENFRWGKISASKWVCFSYAADDDSYDPNDRRFIFVFSKDSNGTPLLWDRIVLMGEDYFGPYIKGKNPDTIVKNGVTYYRYDEKSPELVEPTQH